MTWWAQLRASLFGRPTPTYDGTGSGRRAMAWQVGNPGAVAALAFSQAPRPDTFDATNDRESDTLTLSVDQLPADANLVTTPRGLRLTVNDDSTQLYRVEIPFFPERVDFLELYYLIGSDGVHQLAVLQDDLSVRDAHVTAPDAPLRKGSKARKLLTA